MQGNDSPRPPSQSPVGVQGFREVRSERVWVPFAPLITGDITDSANYGTVWAPGTGYRFVLTGGYVHVHVTVTTNSGSAGSGLLFFTDGTTSNIVLPLCEYDPNGETQGTTLLGGTTGPWRFDIPGDGYTSEAAGNTLYVRGSLSLGAAGTLRVSGMVWGHLREGAA